MNRRRKICLTIAGVDPSGGAGVLADIKTFTAFGCFGMAAVTSLTFQNTMGVFGAVHSTGSSMRAQLDAVFDDADIDAVKTGMLPSADVIDEVAEVLSSKRAANVIVDPVVRSTSGYDLIDSAALSALVERLFPLALLVTPNIPEAERISGVAIESFDDIVAAAEMIRSKGAKNVLIKGGHFDGTAGEGTARDHLFNDAGYFAFDAPMIDSASTHGTGCTLSAAIASCTALGLSLSDAVSTAKAFVSEAIRSAPGIGRGSGPLDHFVKPILPV
ncbi:MAG: bifunctional hydroxymethylpyrimidine kinase/phosphomethylpyrimidine kinase [Acidobacteria bacterium]|nr:bifunctional hydroxymethylpyrimidine kinase/phosphomethylpyrimidine kinase [Acidobacteriota bacterium]